MTFFQLENIKKQFGELGVIKASIYRRPRGNSSFSSARLAAASPRCCA